MKKTCCIVAAGPSEAYVPDGAFVIAADAGVNKLKELNIEPDIIIGDFDSLEGKPEGDNVIVFPVKKDDTDTLLAIKKAITLGYDKIIISGGIGGELDHTIANIQSLIFAAKKSVRAFLVGDGHTLTVINSGEKLVFPEKESGRISVFAICGNAEGVKISGLKYEADCITVTPSFPIGVSNSFIGKKAEISLDRGSLLIVWQGRPEDVKCSH
jgi:thiamine pyrophosphokinase